MKSKIQFKSSKFFISNDGERYSELFIQIKTSEISAAETVSDMKEIRHFYFDGLRG